ncbi:hypothetical protein ABZ636_40745 [Streptomyces sp. NPDC007251]|uniref:hypothetical protein n=1 Tax=Streptomyces sp. NPDC007251 TaxID=3154483 RepID=UPI0033CB858C
MSDSRRYDAKTVQSSDEESQIKELMQRYGEERILNMEATIQDLKAPLEDVLGKEIAASVHIYTGPRLTFITR